MKNLFSLLGFIVPNVAFTRGLPEKIKAQPYNYIITETGMPTSLDPLDGDQTQHLSLFRMIYAPPVSLASDDTLTSQLLSSFRYHKDKKTIEFVLNNNAKYQNGQDITADDVAFAVARMAYTRPNFPVVTNIQGLREWVQKSDLSTYPRGIKVADRKIEIVLDNDLNYPLFRFSLELFQFYQSHVLT